MAELTRQDPILFYAEIPLFEDELHDNGSSDLLVRIVGAALVSGIKFAYLRKGTTAGYANMHLHLSPPDDSGRQRPLQNMRYEAIPFLRI